MEFSFFTTDNKSGYKSTEKWFSKNHLDEYNKIIQHSVKYGIGETFKEKIWVYFNNLTQRPKCLTCNNPIKFSNRFDRGYGDFCSVNCINSNKEEMIKRIKKTMNDKYQVNFFPEHNDFVLNQKKTKKEKYGDENYNNQLKQKNTKKEKYGDENYVNIEKSKETCLLRYGSENVGQSKYYKETMDKRFINLYPDINITKISGKDITILCECGLEFIINKQMMYERYKRKQIICTTCNPFGQSSNSKPQLDVLKFLIDNDISNIVTNNRQILNGKEVDIYLPDFNIAIEYDGLYWHNSSFVENDYHLKKTAGCQEKGVKLIHIFEDEWVHKQEIVKSRILNLLKKTPNKIFARKCVIKELSNDECKKFLNENHIQGNVYSGYKIGLFFNDELISVMTFGCVRSIMSSKNTLPGYELSRFCNKLNTNVIGSASKLFKYFIKTYKPNRVISYADVRWSGLEPENTLYTTLGFKYKHTSKPNYWYVKNEFRYHRSNFTKQSLIKEGFDSTKTEKDIMIERNYNRIYDCGHLVYEIEF
jgi:very-short-patch-repair endonuclease